MPTRSAVNKVKTPVQGDDAWVVIKQPTYGDIRRLTSLAKEGVGSVQADKLTENLDFTASVVSDFVLDWNWVDDDGNPLPKPKGNPQVVEQLTTEEVQAICSLVLDADSIKKNRIT